MTRSTRVTEPLPLTDSQRGRLAEQLSQIVGAGHVLSDKASREFASIDLFPDEYHQVVELVVRPGSTEEVSAVVSLLNGEENVAIIPRAAGLSYAGGAVAYSPAIALDTRRLNQISIHAEDRYAVVGAGCTWEAVAAELRPYELQTTQPSPISGSHSTVGGTVAQAVPGGMDGVIGVTVVLSDGTIAKTGSGMRAGAARFFRYNGPDLTGLFLGDCGAFGIKTEIVLRLAPRRPAAFASFEFDTPFDALHALCAAVATGLVSRALILDPVRNAQICRVSAPEAMSTIGAMIVNARTWRQALFDVFQILPARQQLNLASWSVHLTSEAATETAANAQLDLARSMASLRGREIQNLVPKAFFARPYTIAGLIGPDDERWVPVHGVVPSSRAVACFQSLQQHVEIHSEELRHLEIEVGWLLAASGPCITIEVMYYWRDILNPIHLAYVSQRTRDRVQFFRDNPVARAFVARLRMDHRDIMDAHDAVHTQIARLYRFADVIDLGSLELLTRIKKALDPRTRMTPGTLGIK